MFADRFTALVAGHDACAALLNNHGSYQTQLVVVSTYGLTPLNRQAQQSRQAISFTARKPSISRRATAMAISY
jgi:hypothetical protein